MTKEPAGKTMDKTAKSSAASATAVNAKEAAAFEKTAETSKASLVAEKGSAGVAKIADATKGVFIEQDSIKLVTDVGAALTTSTNKGRAIVDGTSNTIMIGESKIPAPQIADGTSNTIVVGEKPGRGGQTVADGSSNTILIGEGRPSQPPAITDGTSNTIIVSESPSITDGTSNTIMIGERPSTPAITDGTSNTILIGEEQAEPDAQITDGTSNTIMFGEGGSPPVADGSSNTIVVAERDSDLFVWSTPVAKIDAKTTEDHMLHLDFMLASKTADEESGAAADADEKYDDAAHLACAYDAQPADAGDQIFG